MTGVIVGAFGSHALEQRLTPEELESMQTAIRYQMFHALLLVGLGLTTLSPPRMMIWSFVAGVIFFSGSIYLLVLTDWSFLWPVTPLGGTLLIVSWGWLTVWGYGVS